MVSHSCILLLHGLLSIRNSIIKTSTMLFKVSMKTFTLNEKVYSLTIIAKVIQILHKKILVIIHTRRVLEIIKEDTFCATMGLKELNLTINTFLWFYNRVLVFLLQSNILSTLRFFIFCIHINHTEYVIISHRDSICYFQLQFFYTRVFRIIRFNC